MFHCIFLRNQCKTGRRDNISVPVDNFLFAVPKCSRTSAGQCKMEQHTLHKGNSVFKRKRATSYRKTELVKLSLWIYDFELDSHRISRQGEKLQFNSSAVRHSSCLCEFLGTQLDLCLCYILSTNWYIFMRLEWLF